MPSQVRYRWRRNRHILFGMQLQGCVAMIANNNGAAFGHDGDLARLWNTLRVIGWCTVPVLLLLPAVAMQFTSEVQWTAMDFGFAGAVLVGAGLVLELVTRMTVRPALRFGAALVVGLVVMAIWAWAVA
jgi:hypothetical protein